MELILKKYGEMVITIIAIILCIGILIPLAYRVSESTKKQLNKMEDTINQDWE